MMNLVLDGKVVEYRFKAEHIKRPYSAQVDSILELVDSIRYFLKRVLFSESQFVRVVSWFQFIFLLSHYEFLLIDPLIEIKRSGKKVHLFLDVKSVKFELLIIVFLISNECFFDITLSHNKQPFNVVSLVYYYIILPVLQYLNVISKWHQLHLVKRFKQLYLFYLQNYFRYFSFMVVSDHVIGLFVNYVFEYLSVQSQHYCF